MRVGGGITITFTIFDENVSLFFFNLNFTYRPNIFVKRLEKQFTKKKKNSLTEKKIKYMYHNLIKIKIFIRFRF